MGMPSHLRGCTNFFLALSWRLERLVGLSLPQPSFSILLNRDHRRAVVLGR